MSTTDYIHHYTTINTLALILKYRTIRFNRLDRVDDVSEAQAFGRFNLAKNLFVSCWTDSDVESIPQWHIYTNEMTGVRISFPKDLFHYRPLKPPAAWNAVVSGEVLSPIPFSKLFTDDYFILPNILNKNQFERKVQYVSDIQQVYKDTVILDIGPQGKANLQISKVGDLAGYKHEVWQFQSELRFVLFILPSLPLPPSGLSDEKYVEQLPSHIINCIYRGIGPSIQCFDVDINPNVLDNVVVTLGPLATDGERFIVEALLEKYTKRGIVRSSSLTGTIRNPMR